MKKQKTTTEYIFKDKTHIEMADQLNKELPINLKYNEDLIDRVHARYPFLDKTQVSIIVTAIFQGFRDLLVLGKILNFNKLFFDTKLFVFDFRGRGGIFPSLRVKISTPPTMRENNE